MLSETEIDNTVLSAYLISDSSAHDRVRQQRLHDYKVSQRARHVESSLTADVTCVYV